MNFAAVYLKDSHILIICVFCGAKLVSYPQRVPMKDIPTLGALAAALICILLAALGRILHTHFWLTNPTWHELAQTFLLFAIAWGIYQLRTRELRR